MRLRIQPKVGVADLLLVSALSQHFGTCTQLLHRLLQPGFLTLTVKYEPQSVAVVLCPQGDGIVVASTTHYLLHPTTYSLLGTGLTLVQLHVLAVKR